MKVLQVLRSILSHPLNRGKAFAALLRVVRWQLAARLLPEAEFSLPFVNDSRLLVTRGMTDASGTFYYGLHEQDEMGFALHVLRPGDVFVDIGAKTRVLMRLDMRAGTSVLNTVFIERGKIDEVRALVARAPAATLINGSI